MITFTAAAANTISVPVPADTVATCVNDSVAVASGAGATTVAATKKSMVCTSVGSGGGGSAVSAPIFDLKPAQVFATEVEETK